MNNKIPPEVSTSPSMFAKLKNGISAARTLNATTVLVNVLTIVTLSLGVPAIYEKFKPADYAMNTFADRGHTDKGEYVSLEDINKQREQEIADNFAASFRVAEHLYYAKQFYSARLVLDHLLKCVKDPNKRSDLFFARGKCHLKKKENREALNNFTLAFETCKTNTDLKRLKEPLTTFLDEQLAAEGQALYAKILEAQEKKQ